MCVLLKLSVKHTKIQFTDKRIKKYKNDKVEKLRRFKSSNTKEFWRILDDGKKIFHLHHLMIYTTFLKTLIRANPIILKSVLTQT